MWRKTSFNILSNLYKMATLGTTRKWLSWKGGHLIKNLYQVTTNQIWSFVAGFNFFSNRECFIRNKGFGVLVPFLKILKMFSVTFDFECTYIKEVQYNSSAHCSMHLFMIVISSHNHKEQKEPQFFFQFFPAFRLNAERSNTERYSYSV